MQGIDESTVFMVRHRVRHGAEPLYEAWLAKILRAATLYSGYQGRHVVRPAVPGGEYVVMLRFASHDEARTWIGSEDRAALIAEVKDIIEHDDTHVRSGIDFWFDLPLERRPPAWKQWLVTTAVIAPLTMIVPLALAPVFEAIPFLGTAGIRHLITAGIIVAFVTFLIMPRVVRAIRGWLYA